MNQAVIDIGFGDAGKGRVVDYLCSTQPYSGVVRYSGGHQAGHHVVMYDKNGVRKEHVFSNFGCGTLWGVPTYWSSYCTFDPVGFMNELKLLKDLGVSPVFYISGNSPITTPDDKYANRLENKINRHGTCGVGFGKTLEREENRYSLLVKDLFNKTVFDIKLKLIAEYYYKQDVCITKSEADQFLTACGDIMKYITICEPIINNVIFESSQGLLLDQDIGFFPHVTRSNVGTKNIDSLLTTYNLVTRAYQTRHGNGPMTNEHIPHFIKPNPVEQNLYSGYQGDFRETILDLDLLRYGISRDKILDTTTFKNLFITCLDLIQEDRRVTLNGHIYQFDSDKKFVEFIAAHLNIDYKNVYLSYSEHGDMKRLVE